MKTRCNSENGQRKTGSSFWFAHFAVLWAVLLLGLTAHGQMLQYQARLTDPATGAPRDGAVMMLFSLYDVAEDGAALWSEGKEVLAEGGLVNTLLGEVTPLPAAIFDGRALWLGVTVDPDEEAYPRQPVVPVPYAMHAANAAALEGQSAAEFAPAAHEHDAGSMSSGVLDDARIPPSIVRQADVMAVVLDNDGAGSGLDADLLDGLNSSDFVRTLGPASISGNAAAPMLDVTQEGTGFSGRFSSIHGTGVRGSTNSALNGLAGVHGIVGAAGTTITGSSGVLGEASSGKGVVGVSNSSHGVFGWTNTGQASVRGETLNASSTGVYGQNFASSGEAHGVRGRAQSSSGIGVLGEATATSGITYGVKGVSASTNQGAGVRGESSYVGVWGEGGNWGVFGKAAIDGYSVYGGNPGGTGFAGYFAGKTHVAGTLTKSAGSFKIDHPLDPENKYLSHSFVESPDMMNVYNGNAVLDHEGSVWVTLPDYFEALNRDFRYQLTAIGGPGPNLHIAREVAGNQFQIAGGAPGLKVSWQVTGIRQDAFAEANRILVEEMKPAGEKGTYLHPEAHGLDERKAARHATEPAPAL